MGELHSFSFLRESFFADLGRRFCHNSSRKQSTKLSEIHLLQKSNLNGPEVGVGLSPKGWLSCKVISRPFRGYDLALFKNFPGRQFLQSRLPISLRALHTGA
jgi:hypothetical protein